MKNTEITAYFQDFDTILENKERYNIDWSFKDAQEKLDTFSNEIIQDKIKNKCLFCKNKQAAFKDYNKSSHLLLKKQKMQARIFSNMFWFMTTIEFILSIILVLSISEISHTGEGMVDSEMLGIFIVVTFAFLKVFIERFLLKPRLEEFGWVLYERSIHSLKMLTLEINTSLNESIDHLLHNNSNNADSFTGISNLSDYELANEIY
ncbi:MAG: hypothetical protein WBA54_09650 [Acidaminobacteraceae bacterium]